MEKFYVLKYFCFFLLITSIPILSPAQCGMSGKEFWLGFLKNLDQPKNILINISSEYNTTGTVSVPLLNWSSNFSVSAGGMTTVIIPTNIALDIGSEVIQQRGVYIKAADDIVVFAANHSSTSSDATFVLPLHLLRSEYYGLSYGGGWSSTLLIVAAYNNTIIEIEPSVMTNKGNPANVPFTINLNKGETYLIIANDLDISGTRVTGLDSARPFALFGGSECANIPNYCGACDHIYQQLLPIEFWGNNYYLPPLNSQFSLRALSYLDNTLVSINGGMPITLNKGSYHTLNQVSTASVIKSTNPILLAQYMEGSSCAGSGDPSFNILMPIEEKSTQMNFTTINEPEFLKHFLTIITKTTNSGTIKLNGNAFVAAFTPFASDPTYVYAQKEITNGSYYITSENGFSSSVYGTGHYGSYFYSLGNLTKGNKNEEFAELDFTYNAPICAGHLVNLKTVPSNQQEFQWNIDGASATGPETNYVFPAPGLYQVSLKSTGKYCTFLSDSLLKTLVVHPIPELEATGDTTILLGTFTPLQATGGNAYHWSPKTGLSCTNCPNPIAAPERTTTYYVNTKGDNGCTAMDSVTVLVDTDLHIYIPNIFSPNGDGQNDVLYVMGKGIKTMHFLIYNRWGEKVFETTDLSQGWDGTYKGEILQPAVYVFMIDAILETGQRLVKKGDVTLIK
jgi:gliding motility-associated-like protein